MQQLVTIKKKVENETLSKRILKTDLAFYELQGWKESKDVKKEVVTPKVEKVEKLEKVERLERSDFSKDRKSKEN